MAISVGVCDDKPTQIEVMDAYLPSGARVGELELAASKDPVAFLELVRGKRM